MKNHAFQALCFALRRWIIWPLRKPCHIVLLGGPGAGKGTIASQLSPMLGLPHISTGALIRQEIALQTPLGLSLKERIANGGLAPDDDVFDLLVKALKSIPAGHGAILDGFPRTLAQAQRLEQKLESWGIGLQSVIWIELAEPDLIERLSLRRTCTNKDCGRSYHLKFDPPCVESVCDACGHALAQRSDDHPDAISNRLALYKTESMPIRQFYQAPDKEELVSFLQPTNANTKQEVLAMVLSALSK